MTDTNLVALEPCPFCGGNARIIGDDGKFYVICLSEDCYAAVGECYDCDAMPDHFYLNQEDAASAWNTRPRARLAAQKPGREEEENLRDDDRFNKGVSHALDIFARRLGNPEFYASDGSEDYDTDLGDTFLNLLAAANLYDHDEAVFATLPPSPDAALPQDVINLVIAARKFWEANDNLSDESKALDKALEAFSTGVPYENEPDAATDRSELVERLRERLREMTDLFNQCAEARDAAGFLGTVPDCIRELETRATDAEATIAQMREALHLFRAFVSLNAVRWQLGAGVCHHPMWGHIAQLIGDMPTLAVHSAREPRRPQGSRRFVQNTEDRYLT